MPRIRIPRPSPAVLVAVLALAAALAGTAIAGPDATTSALTKSKVMKIATKQASKQINALAPGIADEQITRRAPGLAVATAANADNAAHAASADSAANAAAVDGNIVRRVAHLSGDVTDQQVLDLTGLQLDVTCAGGNEDLDATTTVPGGEISIIREDAGGTNPGSAINDNFGPGDTVQVSNAANSSDNVINLRYTGGDGRVVVAELVTEDDIGVNNCVVSGFAIGG